MNRMSLRILSLAIAALSILITSFLRIHTMASKPVVLVIGGGLAGLSASHTALEHGARVVLLDKKPSLGGNSVKASSGINGADTAAQKQHGISDSIQLFYNDTEASAGTLSRPNLIQPLTTNSAGALTWLSTQFNVDLSLVSRLGGHSVPRTHRGTGGAPGWAMTSALIKKLQEVQSSQSDRVQITVGAKVIRLMEDGTGKIVGAEYEKEGSRHEERADAVIIATGGYAADFSDSGYLSQYRPELLDLPTASGDHATGDGLHLVTSLQKPAVLLDIEQVQVHPTGFVDPKSPLAKTKFLAAEALRGVGGILISKDGERFVNELERRDLVSAKMHQVIKAAKAPIRLILNEQSAAALKTHCDFYLAKGLMRKYESGEAFANEANLPLENLRNTFESHTLYGAGKATDPLGKMHFDNPSYSIENPVFVAEITPVLHYTMGGIAVDPSARVLDSRGIPIGGLYAAGEVIGGVHGQNRLGGSSLLEAVVFGRIAGETAASL
ncbi:Flavocytochrome c [Marasmius fiardii PR-910]|nr:Flavocytochrome c [Marasmius fiardii PR-910]